MNYFERHHDAVSYTDNYKGRDGLRQAQLGAIKAVGSHFTLRNDPAIVVMPTGSGKTGVSMFTAFVERAHRVLVVTPSRLVRDQIVEEYKTLKVLKKNNALETTVPVPRVHEVKSRITSEAMWHEMEAFDVVVGIPKSISPAEEGVAQPPEDLFDLIIVDEAHHSPAKTWNELFRCFPNAKRVLFTATPFRRDKLEIVGKVVYSYPVSKAYEDKIFGEIEFLPVEEKPGTSNDVLIAQAAETVFLEDRAAGLDHFLMVRTDQKKRAKELLEIYETHTGLKLQSINSDHTYSHVRKTIERLKHKELDGIICVDMLGEGFDFPQLKIAAIHAPHKSLAVTLQFIGRFARTNAPNVGKAKFLAVPSEIEGETEHLYREGAVWQEIVTNLSRGRIEEEVASREVMQGFKPPKVFAQEIADLSLYALRPYNHVRIYEVDSATNVERAVELPTSHTLLLQQSNPDQSFTFFITEEKTIPRWTHLDIFTRTEYHLFNIYFDRTTNLLFVNGSCKDNSLYEHLAALFSNTKPKCLPLHMISKVLVDLEDFKFFNIGMRNRQMKDGIESYRIVTGSSAEKSISRSDARRFHQGHTYGKAKQNGKDETIGYSSSSKVWRNASTQIPQFIAWCGKIAKRIRSNKLVTTNSGLDALAVGESVRQLPEDIIAVEWDKDVFDHQMHVHHDLANGSRTSNELLDFEVRIDFANTDKDKVRVGVCGDEVEWWFDYSLKASDLFTPVDVEAVKTVVIQRNRYPESLRDYLNGNPLNFYCANLSKLRGRELFTQSSDDLEPFDRNQIEVVDWCTGGVDIEHEYGNPTSVGMSIHEYLKGSLLGSAAQIVFYDHGSGEVADYITVEQRSTEIAVSLYHCKASGGRKAGARVDDIYEVCGQTIKSLIWLGGFEN